MGVHVFTDRLAFTAADWCFRLHGWPIMPPLLGVYDFTAGLPPSPPTGASAYTAGLLCRRCWVSTTSPPACLRRRRLVPPPTRLAYYAAAVGRLRPHRRPASVAAEWCLRLHGWPIMPLLLGVNDFTAGLPPSPPSGASAYTAGLLCRCCWASTTSPPARLRHRRAVPPPTRLAYYAAAVGRLRLHRRPASVAAEWCLRLHGWPIMPPLLGVYDFTAGLPPLPPSGASAYTAGLLCRRCWASTTSPPACLRRRRLVPPPIWLVGHTTVVGRLRLHHRPASVAADWIQIQICIKGIHGFKLISYAPGMDQSEHHHRLASTAADWCFRLHGWPIMPPLLGVYVFTDRLAFAAADWCFRLHGWPIMPPLLGVCVFTDRLAFAAADWCFRLHGWPLCRRCWASTSSPTGRLDHRRLVFPPARLAYYAADVGRLHLHRPAASSAADWCFRLHGWPLCRRCWAFTSSPTGLPSPPPTGVSACTAGLLCRRCWASTSSPTGLPSPPPTGVSACTAGLYAAAVGRLRLHRPAASTAADWCFRLHGWPLCRRCWASTSSPTGRLVRRRLVFPPARLAFMPPLLGVYVFTDRLAFAAADWCFRLHGWPLCRRCWAFTSLPTGLPSPPPTGVSACTAGLLCRRCWASTSSPTGLPSPPPTGVSACTAGLYAAAVGRLRLHRPAASTAADWCFRLHGWPIMLPLLGVYIFTDRPPRPPPTGVSACTAGLYAAAVGRLRLHRPAASSAADWCFRLHGWPLCRRCWASTSSPTGLPSPPPTGVSACTAGLYAAAVGRLRLHRPACLRRRRLVFPPARLAYYAAAVGRLRPHRRPASVAAEWCLRLHGWPIMPLLLGVNDFTAGLPSPPPTGVSACTAGLYAAVVGRLRLHRPAASSAADWCFRLHGWPIMPPLLGVYVFTDRLAFAAADWCFRLHGWPLCRRCWASTSSPTGLPSPPPTGVSACTAGLYAAVVGRLRLHRPAASSAADWCFRLHGWPIMSPLLGVYVFTDRLAFAAADWCFRLHGWPLCRRCWASTSSPTGLPSSPPTGVLACTAGLYAAVVGRLRLHRPACLRRRRLVFPPARLAFMPPLLGVYVFTDRPPHPPLTGVTACTAGLL
uniref:cysteine dioxygenase n=1 Tax=Oryza sativa subsp. japonica TaxID=39947 RepID=Q69Q34_ORYSJ|nr:HGWP repeat containing protein-like [Oryza sativa Japonica Group]BAD36119.1 HGWP repeat containing protein-like [Oryza sativa Japonica Group]